MVVPSPSAPKKLSPQHLTPPADIKAHARDALIRAGARSESLAARRAALSYFEQANDLADEPALKADLLTRAANMAMDAGLVDRGRKLYDRAIEIAQALGDEVSEARIEIRRAFMATADGLLEDSLARMTHAHGILSKYPPGPDLAEAAAEISRLSFFMGQTDRSLEFIERALPIAEELFLPEILSMALNTKALIMRTQGRSQEGMALLRHALRLALEHDAPGAAMRAYNNMASQLDAESAYQEIDEVNQRGLALARKVGHQGWEAKFLSGRVPLLVLLGRWDEALLADAEAAEVPDASKLAAMAMERTLLGLVHAVRGDFELAERYQFRETLEASDDVQAVGTLGTAQAMLGFYAGRSFGSAAFRSITPAGTRRPSPPPSAPSPRANRRGWSRRSRHRTHSHRTRPWRWETCSAPGSSWRRWKPSRGGNGPRISGRRSLGSGRSSPPFGGTGRRRRPGSRRRRRACVRWGCVSTWGWRWRNTASGWTGRAGRRRRRRSWPRPGGSSRTSRRPGGSTG